MTSDPTRVSQVLVAKAEGAYTNDDQVAILAGAERDGFLYRGAPSTPGYTNIRQPASALSVMVVLSDGHVVFGDGVSVQYAGRAGRDGPLQLSNLQQEYEPALGDALTGIDVTRFRDAVRHLDVMQTHPAVLYGASQALLAAAAHARRATVAEVVRDEYSTGVTLAPIPIFAQSGEDRRMAVDRMVLRRADALPHGLINNASTLIGAAGEHFTEYIGWVRDRVLALRTTSDYAPTLHFDCYGTIGEVFPTAHLQAEYLAALADVAAPLRLRIEHPAAGTSRANQVEILSALRDELKVRGADVQIVADEWCNTLEDVQAFIDGGGADMIQIKMPDLGTVDSAIHAALLCRRGGVATYIGGSCTETERSAQVCAGIAMGVGADLLLARPGMGVDEAIMVVRNEMSRTMRLVANVNPATTHEADEP